MGLPKIDMPLFELEVPSTKQKVKYRPFTVKEEKILLMAQESKDFDQMITSIKQIINNCIDNIDVDSLAMFDLEYILINIRAQSVDNMLEFKIKDPDTEEEVELQINIRDIKINTPEDHNKNITINDGAFIIMRYPSLEELSLLYAGRDKSDTVKAFNIMINCIDSIVNNDEVYKLKDYTEDEINEFVDGLNGSTLKSIEKFFQTMPKLRHEIKYTNKNDVEKTFVIEGTESFFI